MKNAVNARQRQTHLDSTSAKNSDSAHRNLFHVKRLASTWGILFRTGRYRSHHPRAECQRAREFTDDRCIYGAVRRSTVVALTCACGSQVCEAIVPESFTCTTSALLVERIGWMSHNASRVAKPPANLGERAGNVARRLRARSKDAGSDAGAELTPGGIWHSGWARARAWQND